MIYNIEEYGANPNNKNNSEFIQKAIDDAFNNGGGKVIVPSKEYRIGSLVLKSNVELYLEAGSKLKASDDLDDFNLFMKKYNKDMKLEVPTYEDCEYDGNPIFYLIYAKDAYNISITGLGSIDGNEKIFYGKEDKYQIDGKFYPRMPLIYFENVKHINLLNCTFQNSAFWTTHLVGCEDITISNLKILNNLKLANCDGIDLDHSKDVRISNCYIHAADDGIVFKNTQNNIKYGVCENICVTNCTIISTSGAIKFGTESCSNFKNITISNINIHSSNRGISFQLRDNGNISNVIFSNINISNRIFSEIQWWGRGEGIFISAVKRFENTTIGNISNVVFENININSENGIYVYGEDNSFNISNITFKGINLDVKKKSKFTPNVIDLRPRYKDNMLKNTLTLLYLKNAKNITVSNFNYSITNELKTNCKLRVIKNCRLINLD